MPRAGTDDSASRRRERTGRLRGLYAVTPDLADTADLVARVERAIDGGASALQYRNKTAGAARKRGQAEALADIAAERGVLYIVNDDGALCAAVNADGVHLCEDDGGIAAARVQVGPERIIGVSCYDDFGRAEAAIAAGADYVAFGSFFASSVKPGARRADVALLARAATLRVPVVAIGGITAQNAGELARAGAHALAVISAVFEAPDVRVAARAIADVYSRSSASIRSKTS
jgi:thiamine-phosphate pyrophosphorylase